VAVGAARLDVLEPDLDRGGELVVGEDLQRLEQICSKEWPSRSSALGIRATSRSGV
jgi:hypothetical protein